MLTQVGADCAIFLITKINHWLKSMVERYHKDENLPDDPLL